MSFDQDYCPRCGSRASGNGSYYCSHPAYMTKAWRSREDLAARKSSKRWTADNKVTTAIPVEDPEPETPHDPKQPRACAGCGASGATHRTFCTSCSRELSDAGMLESFDYSNPKLRAFLLKMLAFAVSTIPGDKLYTGPRAHVGGGRDTGEPRADRGRFERASKALGEALTKHRLWVPGGPDFRLDKSDS